jgi:hypothetical protein
VRGQEREKWVRAGTHPSQLIVVRVEVMETFDHVSRRTQDLPAVVDGVQQVHGHSTAGNHLYIHTQQWAV